MVRFLSVVICITLVVLTSGGPLNINDHANKIGSKLMVNEKEFINIIQSNGQKPTDTDSAGIKSLSCGTASVPPRDMDRIVGGVEARPGSHPWIVSLGQSGQHFCGGTLIPIGSRDESDIVVTAAHCVYDGVSGMTVTAGTHDLDRPGPLQQTVGVDIPIHHQDYDPDTMMNDIAILKLDQPIKYNDHVRPICLPDSQSDSPVSNEQMTVAGWGSSSENGDISNVLMQVSVPLVSTSDCATMYQSHDIKIDEHAMICAGHMEGGKDHCQGDNGGPLFAKRDNQFTLHGVVSFGIGCARPGLPGVYAQVATYVPWINEKIIELSNVN